MMRIIIIIIIMKIRIIRIIIMTIMMLIMLRMMKNGHLNLKLLFFFFFCFIFYFGFFSLPFWTAIDFHHRLDVHQRPWEVPDDSLANNSIAKQAYTALIRVTPKMPQTATINSFLESVQRIARDEFNSNFGREEVCIFKFSFANKRSSIE